MALSSSISTSTSVNALLIVDAREIVNWTGLIGCWVEILAPFGPELA